MTEDDRMERAKRIRRMREGKRVGDDADEETGDQENGDAANADEEAEHGPEARTESTAEPATTDGGTSQVTEDAATDPDEADDDAETAATELDDEAAETVEQGSGTRAPIPSAEEMAAALEDEPAPAGEQDDSEAAQAVAEASAARKEGAAATDAAPTPADPSVGVPAKDGPAEAEPAEDGSAASGPAEERQAEDETAEDEPADSEQAETAATGAAGRAGATSTTTEDQTRVLEFTLDDEQYCLDIQYIEEIVKQEAITRVPNTPDFVEGVVDLRGQITTILNPKVTIGKEHTEAGELIVVFEGDGFEEQGHVGWIVDDVRQVSPVTDDQLNNPPMDDDHIEAVIDREEDDEFVVWTTPELAFEETEG